MVEMPISETVRHGLLRSEGKANVKAVEATIDFDPSKMTQANILDHLLSSPVAKPVIHTSGPNSR
jgi:hypothetical protein